VIALLGWTGVYLAQASKAGRRVGSVLTWVLGNVLFGISIIRAKTFSRWAGILLIVGTAIIPVAYLTGLSVHVVAIGGAVAAAGQVWLGYELLQ